MIKIGITGTRSGLTEQAKEYIYTYLETNADNISEIHHGDCVGVDEEIHNLIDENYSDIKLVVHPPTDNKHRAHCESDDIKKEYDYIKRNHNIVNDTDILVAFPPTQTEILRSGTWSTIRYARKKKKNVCVVYPDGNIE
jgi:hypothetical protein